MGYNILLVDDSNVVKAVLSKILAGSPLPIDQVYDAANGVEALKILNADTIDLVITDINMPLMDGFELIERMRLDMMLKDIPGSSSSPPRVEPHPCALPRGDGHQGLTVRQAFCRCRDQRRHQRGSEGMSMTENPSEHLTEALAHALVSMVAMSPRVTDAADMPEMKADALNVRIEYSGEHRGELGLIMERPLAVRFALARILWVSGTRESGTSMTIMVEDALKELLITVVCGHFLTLIVRVMPPC
jgi:hypothetical protein